MNSRDRFEAWVKSCEDYKEGDLATHDHSDQPYIKGDMQLDWEIWQAFELSSKTRIDRLRNSLTDIRQNGGRLGVEFCVIAATNALNRDDL